MLDNLKKDFKNRIEKNAVKSVMSWEDSEGNIQTEVVYMKRSRIPIIGDWGRIYPVVNEDNTWNIMNLIFGGRRNFIKLAIIVGLIGLLFYGISDIFHQCEVVANNLCVKNCLA